MSKRDELVRAMNPAHGKVWSAEAQELNLLLHDLAADPPEGWTVAYEVCDDDSAHNPRNRDAFDRERKPAWRRELARRRDVLRDEDAADDLPEIPADAQGGAGHHVLLVLTHEETRAQIRRWVDRAELVALVRRKDRTPAQKIGVVRGHVDAALAAGGARVDRKWGWIVREIQADPAGPVAQRWAERFGLRQELREALRAAAADDAGDDVKAAPDLVVERLVAAVESRRQARLNGDGKGRPGR